jgi:hypothetical protein
VKRGSFVSENSSKTFEEILEILKIVFLKWNARNVWKKREREKGCFIEGSRRIEKKYSQK